MEKLSDLRLSKSMKYAALYWAMGFDEYKENVYEKKYKDNTCIKIDSNSQSVYINSKHSFFLDTHYSFVKLECINRLLSLDNLLIDFGFLNSLNSFQFKDLEIKFLTWEECFNSLCIEENIVLYKSRLISGVLEYEAKIVKNNKFYDLNLFENNKSFTYFNNSNKIVYKNNDLLIKENRLIKYIGKDKLVVIPEGIEELESASFWDNQYIEEVRLPDTLKNMGGDTFYNCKNLKRVNIPKMVKIMGNNPFAGCPLVNVINYSNSFIYKDKILYSNDMTRLIYCSIRGSEHELIISNKVTTIGKHAFFLCDRFQKITLPLSLKKIENNPFSGCSKLEIINNSKAYYIKEGVIYNKFKTAVVGTINKIQSKKLELLEGVKTINRNSFWNCGGVITIVFPSTLVDIGYNPFVGCSNIHFISNSTYFKVIDDILYNADCSKLICYPSWKAIGEIHILDSVNILERGAFSGCDKMTTINLHNVNIINKSCFTNCFLLKNVHCSDLIYYIGEWAFAYCRALKKISINKETIIDNNALSNCNAKLVRRRKKENYIIESDNIFTLKSMVKNYGGKIDSILIDPPYNSHIDYIGYKDSNYKNGYISFIKERVDIAYKLLSENGFMIVNIDKGEYQNIFSLCKSIFGEDLVDSYRWKKRHAFFDVNKIYAHNQNKKTIFEYIIICKKSKKSKLNLIKQPCLVDNALIEKDSTVPRTFDLFGTTSSAKDEIASIFGNRDYFSTPKPLKLIKEFVRATTCKDSIVFDFFAGSGTVGHAVNNLNLEDRGNRCYILISNNESNICRKVTVKRMKKVNSKFIFLN